MDQTISSDVNLYDNQRPDLAVSPANDRLLLTWERRYEAGSSQIYLMELDDRGNSIGVVEEVTGRFELSRSPQIAFDGQEPVLVWFTSPSGNSRVIIGRRGTFRWESQTLSPLIGEATFPRLVTFQGRLHIVWQSRSGERGSSIVYSEPDQSVDPPVVLAGNFGADRRSSLPVARFTLQDPPDSSGIRGYAWRWSQDPQAAVDPTIQQRVPNRGVEVIASEEGRWYLRVRATDFAGNWSEATTATFILDTTPPPPVVIPPPAIDENGFVVSNTFAIGWEPPSEEEHLGGYAVQLEYVGEDPSMDDAVVMDEPYPLPPRITSRVARIRRENVADGVWRLAVAAVDSVGNVGPAVVLPLRFNKYEPTTEIFDVRLERNLMGEYLVRVTGRGFTTRGTVEQVVVDRDGLPPFDYRFSVWRDRFEVVDDRRIEGIRMDEVEEGSYRLGVVHSERGLTLAEQTVTIDAHGVVKYGDFEAASLTGVAGVRTSRGRYAWSDVVFLLVSALALLIVVTSSVRLVGVQREIAALDMQARVLITGRDERGEISSERIKAMKTQGFGLRVKFASFVLSLVVGIVALVAVMLGRNALERQETVLTQGLRQRIELLVEGQSTGSRPALQNPQLNIDQLQNVANQGEAMADALYVTITGLDDQGTIGTIYGTSDPAILAGEATRIDTESYIVGLSKLTDEVSDTIDALSQTLNTRAATDLGGIPEELERLSQEAQRLILQGAGEEEIARIDRTRSELLRRGREQLARLEGQIRSEPEFDFSNLRRDQTTYLFYRPILDIVPGAGAEFSDYYRGAVRVMISTQLILDEIDATTRDLIWTTAIVAAAAVVVGMIGALVLATIVVRPINRLVLLVERIGATEDKSELKGESIDLNTRDELNVLAESINGMVDGLVKAAEADRDLKFGKETQKAFIPLEPITDDTKRTFGELDERLVYFFGYYEGAKGVSGDYFTYLKLSERYYATIKCDVAGKGIPAALIMVQVATIFQDYFSDWTIKRPGLDVASLVLRINDIVAERQFKGRFAALTAGILDAHSGSFYLANAGDNQLHVFRAASRGVEQLTIPGGPAAGTFSSNDLPITFPQEMRKVNRGDMLLLFTDGLEEAKRLLRHPNWQPFVVTQEMIDAGEVREGLSVDEDGEEFSIARIHAIVTAVAARGTYRLEKVMDPEPNADLLFDYSNCENDARDTVLAIVAAERIFRLVPDPSAGPDDRVEVDRVVIEFLRAHFVRFSHYFSHPVVNDSEDGKNQYLTFSHLKEDPQFDDITMLVARRR